MKPNKNHPPRWADRFLEWYCRPELLEEIQGDIYELFDKRLRDSGAKAASRRFIWDVLRSFRLSTIRNLSPNLSAMLLKTNLKIAWRQVRLQKMYALIKIGGFAIGIAACLLIALFIRDELSYDRHFPDADRIYRLIGVSTDQGRLVKFVWFPAPMAATLEKDFPEVEKAGKFNPTTLFDRVGSNQLKPEGEPQNTFEEGFIYADQRLLDVLQPEMVYGQWATALSQPNTIVLSRRKADKYFPGENPIGKRLILNNEDQNPFTIGGVMENFPANSHFNYDFILSLEGFEFYPGEQTLWRADNYHTYLLLRPGTDPAQLETKLLSVIDNYYIPAMQEAGRANAVEAAKRLSFELQPVPDIHLRSTEIYDGLSHGDIRLVWLFGAIAGFILLLAGINFINLSTARAANRAKEVGVRKVVGSFRSHLVGQFLTESVLFSFFSFFLGLVLASILMPHFNELAGKSLTLPWGEWWFVPLLTLATLGLGLLAGLYPSFYLSAFKPIHVLNGKLSRGSKGAGLRNTLVVFQFTTSIVLIIGTFIIYQQMDFILHKKLGFNKEQVVLLHGTDTMADKVPTLKKELLQLPEVQQVSVSDYLPITGTKRNGNSFWREGQTTEEEPVPGQIWRVDHDYIQTMGMEITEGRDFSIDMPTDSQAMIINQKMAEEFGFEDPVGQRITNSRSSWNVIGVVDNFHYESMRDNIRPLALVIGNSPSIVSAKVNAADMPGLITRLTAVWDSFSPGQPIRYSFLDESYERMYADVQRTGLIFRNFAILAVLVAGLGLFALSSFIAEQRRKEIGIRKVLGASVSQILGLLTQNFVKLVLISLLIAIPLGWYLMRQWLDDFAYRIAIRWEVFLLAGLTALFIALLTISFQAFRSATANPVDSIRNE